MHLSNRSKFQVMKLLDSPKFKRQLKPFFRKTIRKEVNRALAALNLHVPLQRSLLCEADQSPTRSFKLCFDCEIPKRIFTCNKIEAEGLLPLKVVLQDTKTGAIVSQGPLSSSRLEIVLLPGDFKAKDKEFSDNILLGREGRGPLLIGDRYITLQNGVAFFQGPSISDNSSWISCRKFMFGARVVDPVFPDAGVSEGVSGAFIVLEKRGESYKKHKIPALEDEIWRLYKIAKGGKYCQNLAANGIHTVKDFLQRYYTDPSSLRSILCVSNNKWDAIVEHAKSCSLNNDLYSYYSEEGAVGIVFNCVLDIVGITYDFLNYGPLEILTAIQKAHVGQIRRHVYVNQSLLVPFEQQTDPFTDSSLANLHPVDVNDQTEEDMNFSFGYPVSASAVETYPCLGEQSNHLIDVTQLQQYSTDNPIRISNVLLSPNGPITLENDVFNGSYNVPSNSNSLTRNGLYAPLPNLG